MENVKTSIDKKSLSFIVPFFDNEENYTMYIPMPSEARAEAAAPILGALFSLKANSRLAPAVLARDYEVYAKKACRQIAEENNSTQKEIEKEEQELFNNFKGFIEASVLAGNIITKDYNVIKIAESKVSRSSLEFAIGLYVFFFVALRYAEMILSKTEKDAFLTSLTLMEYIKSLPTL